MGYGLGGTVYSFVVFFFSYVAVLCEHERSGFGEQS